MKHAHHLALACLNACLLAGCSLGPNATRPISAADNAKPYTHAVQTDDAKLPGVTHWWNQFHDEPTNQLVDQALKDNIDLRIAAANVLESRALLGAAVGQRLPSVDMTGGRDRAKNSFNFGGSRFSSHATTWSLDATVNWQVDIFGKLRRAQEQSQYQLLASEADRQAVTHTVIAETVRARARIATLQRQAKLVREQIDSFRKTAEVIQHRFDTGVTSALDTRLARENLKATEAQLPEIRYQLEAARMSLDVLLGLQPGTGPRFDDTLAELPDLALPPTGLPGALLDRRPDLQATELRAMGEQAGIGVALADMFPDLTLTAGIGFRSSAFDKLLDARSVVWDIASQFAWKVFRGGALQANVDAAHARAERAGAQYAKAVLLAMQDVENALVREQTARQRYDLLKDRLHEAREAEKLANDRYDRGVENILSVLEAERRRRTAEDDLVAAQFTIWSARVDLFLSLGGDWEAQPPAPAPKGDDLEKSPD
ncbi:MAG: efflux transporter outer membrane subunit [Phycisphaerales bacterium]